MHFNPYEILEVRRDATLEEIRKQYRKLAMEHHPDRTGDDTQFKLINEAYHILIDPVKRRHWEQHGNVHVPKEEIAARDKFIGLFLGLCERFPDDPFKHLHATIKQQDEHIKREKINVARKQTSLRNIQKRLKYKGEAPTDSLLYQAIENVIEEMSRQTTNMDFDLKVNSLVRQLANDYTATPENKARIAANAGTSTVTFHNIGRQ